MRLMVPFSMAPRQQTLNSADTLERQRTMSFTSCADQQIHVSGLAPCLSVKGWLGTAADEGLQHVVSMLYTDMTCLQGTGCH